MRTAPIVPARIESTADGVPWSPDFGDVYHPAVGAAAQAGHVFLAGNELPRRWQGRDRFTIVETGFGLGHNFLAAWAAWRRDPLRSTRLVFVSVELHPPTREQLAAQPRDTAFDDLAHQLVDAWPPATPNLHRLAFDDARVTLLLGFGDAAALLREIDGSADAFFLDGFAPARNPALWSADVCKALARLAAPGATLATWTAAHAVRERLAAVGFDVRLGAGIGGKRDITLAQFRPVFRAPPSARRPAAAARAGRALIVGGGLAGASTAAALAEQGWRCTVLEQAPTLAAGASGNPAGLFHGTLHADDGVHARVVRAAALALVPVVRAAIARDAVAGAVCGLLRLELRIDHAAMRALLARSGLPPAYVEALDTDAASARAGLSLPCPAWHYPGGGWVDPAALVRSRIGAAGSRVETRISLPVGTVRRAPSGAWQAVDVDGRTIDEADTLVLAHAGDALGLLGVAAWPLARVRGQLSVLPRAAWPERLAVVVRPVAGGAYVIPTCDGVVFGATRQRDDADPAVRSADHLQNLTRLEALVGSTLDIDAAGLSGRTAWRCTAPDRLPLIGPVPALDVLRGERPVDPRWAQPRHVPREPGLFVFTALGARGITLSELGARTLAASIAGGVVPLESGLVDAVDPARFVSRAVRLAERTSTG